MIPLSTWTTFGPEIISAVIGGFVAGLTAWWLLGKTQRDEARIRAEDRADQRLTERKKTVSLLLIDVRNMADLLTSQRVQTIRSASTYSLRNQIAVATIDMGKSPLLDYLNNYATYARRFRDWVRNAPENVADGFEDPRSSSQQQLEMSQRAIRQFADALEERLRIEVGSRGPTIDYPELPALEEWPPY